MKIEKVFNCLGNNEGNKFYNLQNQIYKMQSIIQDWYTNHSYYHLIGLLIWDGEDILSLIKKYQESTKTDFLVNLFQSIKERLNTNKTKKL